MSRYNPKVFSSSYKARWFEEEILHLGEQSFTRDQMVTQLHLGHFNAAKTVSAVLRRMRVTTSTGIRRIPLTDWARVQGFGEASLRVLLELLVFNGETTAAIDRWLTVELKGHKLVQWSAICHQAAVKGRKRGKHAKHAA